MDSVSPIEAVPLAIEGEETLRDRQLADLEIGRKYSSQ